MTTPSRTLGCKATALLWMGAAAALWWSMAALRPPASGICAIYLAVHRGQCSWRWNGCIWSACGYGGQSASHREGDLLAGVRARLSPRGSGNKHRRRQCGPAGAQAVCAFAWALYGENALVVLCRALLFHALLYIADWGRPGMRGREPYRNGSALFFLPPWSSLPDP